MANAVLAVLRDGQKIKDFEIQGEAWVGRSDLCAVKLDDRAISREHALVRVTPQGLELVKKSQFGQLFLNGAPVTHALLKSGDQIGLGPFVIEVARAIAQGQVKTADTSAAPVTPVAPVGDVEAEPDLGTAAAIEAPLDLGEVNPGDNAGAAPALTHESTGSLSGSLGDEAPSNSWDDAAAGDGATRVMSDASVQARLEFAEGAANVTEVVVAAEPVVIGRGKNCTVVLNDKKASRRHTLVERVGQKFIVRDLGSVNGTFVNEVKVEEYELTGDDVLRIGDTEFHFKVLNLDFGRQQGEFLQVPDDSEAVGSDFGGVSAGDVAVGLPQYSPQHSPIPMAGDAAAMGAVGHAPLMAGMTAGGAGGGGSLVDKLKAMGPRKLILRAAIVLGALYFLFDEDSAPKPTKKPEVAKRDPASKVPAATNKLTFEKLSEEQKKFVIAQHDIAFEFYRNKEYDKALIEVRKIFELVDDFKDSREIERYAIEGKRKMEAIEEERRKEREKAELLAKIEGVKMQIQDLMTQKKYKEAREIFPRLQELDPENPMIGKWQAEIKTYYDDIEMAEKRKETVAAVNAAGWDLYRKAATLKKRNQCRPAIAQFRTIAESDVTDRKLIGAAKAGISGCLAQIESQVKPLMDEAKAAELAAEFAKAFQHYERVDVIDPGHRGAREGRDRIRGVLHEKAKLLYTEAVVAESYSDFEQAKRKFEDCLATAPKDDIYHERARRKLNKFLRLEGAMDGVGGGEGRGAASL